MSERSGRRLALAAMFALTVSLVVAPIAKAEFGCPAAIAENLNHLAD